MPSYRPVDPPAEIPPGTSDHIAESIRRAKLEAEQHRILKTVEAELGIQIGILKRHRRRNASKYRAKNKRRLRISEAPEPFTRQEIITRDHGRCHICGKTCTPHEIHIDHDIPLSRGGAHTRDNVRVACSECNTRKGSMTTSEYRATLRAHSSRATRTNE